MGQVGLLVGPPGSGKSMAAQVIAADLGLDLFRIEMASVLSRYVGDTSKRLRQIFRRASQMNAVLLFDEADALFARRVEQARDATDRYANADTNGLLLLIEEYDRGPVLLATNRQSALDPALHRRIRYVFEFERPTAPLRLIIWRRLLTELCGAATVARLKGTIEAISTQVDFSGAQIKDAVLSSIFLARQAREPLDVPHVLRAIDRELAKAGSALGPRQLQTLKRNART